MQIHHDVLPENLLEECCIELHNLMQERCWGSSTLRWDPLLKEGIVGDSIHTYIPDNHISYFLPPLLKVFGV